LGGWLGFAGFGCAKPVACGFLCNNRDGIPDILSGTCGQGIYHATSGWRYDDVSYNPGFSGVGHDPTFSCGHSGIRENHSIFGPLLSGGFFCTTDGNDDI